MCRALDLFESAAELPISSYRAIQELAALVDRRSEQVLRALHRETQETTIRNRQERRTLSEKASTLAIIVSHQKYFDT
jgi:hypothetical protein